MSYHVIICGQSGCGKTTVARHLSARAFAAGRRSLVFDPKGEDWGPHALVFSDPDDVPRFWETAWRTWNCQVIVEEVSTVMPRDRSTSKHFKRIRHQGHQLMMLLHYSTDLLPDQRDQAGTLYLFNQDPDSVDKFARSWNEPRLMEAAPLPPPWFLYAQKFADRSGGVLRHYVTKSRLTL